MAPGCREAEQSGGRSRHPSQRCAVQNQPQGLTVPGKIAPGRHCKQHMDVAFPGCTHTIPHRILHQHRARGWLRASCSSTLCLSLHQLINSMRFCPRSGGPATAPLRCLEQLLSALMESWEKSSPPAAAALPMPRSMINGVTAPVECLLSSRDGGVNAWAELGE